MRNVRRATNSGQWGDARSEAKGETLRVAFNNVGGIPVDCEGDKHSQVIRIMSEGKIDVLGIQEHNLNLQRMSGRNTWKSRFRKWHKHWSRAAWNMHTSSKEMHLYGGTAMFVGPDNFHRINTSEGCMDGRGLGRWTGVVLQGQHNMRLRIISAYRPVTDSSNRPLSVFSQQESVLLQHGDFRDPRTALFEDLQTAIEQWHAEGDMIILGMDANENVTAGPKSFAKSCNLVSVMEQQHPRLLPTATCNKNRSNVAVDGVWCSPGLDIVRCGMTGFGDLQIGNSDHRLLWLDVSKLSAFGYIPPVVTYKQPNRLNLRDPRCVAKYNKSVRKKHDDVKVLSRARDVLQRYRREGVSLEMRNEYDKVSRLNTKIRAEARRRCRKLPMGKVPFSDVVQNHHRKIKMCKLVINRRQGLLVDTKIIRRMMRQTENPTALTWSEKEALKMKDKFWKAYRKDKKRAEELRVQFGKRVAIARAKKYKTSVQSEERLTQQCFRMKAAFGRIGAQTKKPRLAISYVTSGPSDNPTHHQSRHDIEKALMEEGTARFLQSYGTDMTVAPLADDFPHVLCKAVDEVLAGTYVIPEDTGEFARKMLQQLTLLDGVPPEGDIGAELDVDRHIAGWRKMKGKTNSSPFGPGFVDHIAGCEDRVIATVDALLGYIPCVSGMIPEEWLHVIDSMIPKKKNSTHVAKLRMIVLFHALNNFQNKHFGGRMVHGMEERNQIPLEAYGSRKKHRAIECALNKVFTADHIRQRHLTAALVCSDAKSCYDRILHLIAAICMRRAGLKKETCFLMLGSMEEMQHHIRTVYGDSATSYTGVALPFQGIYQGNGAGPAVWLIVSIPVIQMLRDEGFGLKTITAIKGDEFNLVCYTFVDDTDLIHCLPAGNSDTEELVKEMQSMVDHWDGGIRFTGGALVPDKSFWFLISQKYSGKNDRWTYRSVKATPGEITVLDTNGDRQVIERLDMHEARETLGVWIAMDGNEDEQYEALETKILEWGNKVRGRALSTTDALLGLRACLSMSLRYPLAACTLSRKSLKALTSLLMKTVLPTLGIPKSFPRVLLHTPDLQVGYHLPCLDIDAGYFQLEVILRNLNDRRLTGKLLNDTYETLQLELGVEENPLCMPFKPWAAAATPTWLTGVWEFCSAHNIEMRTPSIHIPTLRKNDEYLMKRFVQEGYKGDDLRRINLCRKWHRVVRVSEIVTGDGTKIRDDARKCGKSIGCNKFNWANESCPSKRCWKLWDEALTKCFIDHTDRTRRLQNKLGDWIGTPTSWDWWFSPSEDRIFHVGDESTTQYINSAYRPTRRPAYNRTRTVLDVPNDAIPTTCYGSKMQVRHEGFRGICQRIEEQEQAWWDNKLMDTGSRSPLFFEGVSQGTAVIICDGSLKDGWGTAAVIALPSILSLEPVISAHLTPGPKHVHSAYRAELAGIVAGVLEVEQERADYHVTEGSVTVACDCDAALNTFLYCRQNRPSPSAEHFDLASQLHELLQASTIEWKGKEIKGHQDDHRPYHELTVWEQWNVDADTIAKHHWQEFSETIPFYHLPPLLESSIWKDGQRFVCWDRTLLYTEIFGNETREYWTDRYNFERPETIDFVSMGRAFKNTAIYKRLWLSKLLTNRVPTRKNIAKWTDEVEPDICPRCGETEDIDHIVWCQDSSARERREVAIQKLEDHLFKRYTAPSLRKRIISLLSDENPIAYDETGDITPELMTKGFILQSWTESQQSYLTWIGKKTTGRRWASQLIQHLWDISWDMWRHREKIAKAPESQLLAHQHSNLNHLIQTEFALQHAAPNQRLQRWFGRPLSDVCSQSIDFKEQWLDVVSTTRQAHLSR